MPPTTTSTSALTSRAAAAWATSSSVALSLDEQLDGTAEHATLGVDVVDDHLSHVDICDAHEGKGSGLVADDPDPGRTVDGACRKVGIYRVRPDLIAGRNPLSA
jgi:hypothetical protein